MKQQKIGELIRNKRISKGMTQLRLAELLSVSDKTVSKWECGGGSPDLSMFDSLSEILEIDIASLVNGEYCENKSVNGNLKKLNFFVCQSCGNITWQIGNAAVTCCGHKLKALEAVKADNAHQLKSEHIDNDFYITSEHEMTREHYISFIAFVTSDSVTVKKLYPEWSLDARIPYRSHGRLFGYCTKDGLFYCDI